MEHTGVTPRGAVVAPDLAELVQRPGPFATVYLTTEARVDNATHRSQQRWKVLRSELEDAGVPGTVLSEIDDLVPEAHLEGQTLGVVATAGGVAHVEHSPGVPPRDRALWAPLPSLVPILTWRQAWPPYLTVLADRAGADIDVFRHERTVVHEEAGGATDPLARSKPGGWSQRRYQQRAENTWEDNAEDVAALLKELCDRYDVRLVVAAGDERALQLMEKELPTEVTDRLDVVDGGRSADGSENGFSDRVAERLARAVADDTAGLVEKLREELGQSDRAVTGAAATLAALAAAQVEVLLVADARDAEDGPAARFGPEPTQIGLTQDELAAFGGDDPLEAPLVDVAVRAALATGAGIRVAPAVDLADDGIAAILRWS